MKALLQTPLLSVLWTRGWVTVSSLYWHHYSRNLPPVVTLSLLQRKNAQRENLLSRDTHILFFGQLNRKGLGYLDYDFLGADKPSAKEIF